MVTICLCLQHIKDMVLALQKIAVNTSLEHHDYEELKNVIECKCVVIMLPGLSSGRHVYLYKAP